mgnify:CR=1 FL=1
MCIRDRHHADQGTPATTRTSGPFRCPDPVAQPHAARRPHACLLYTSDAADERSSVDLGGRRIIKKKKPVEKAKTDDHQVT